MSTSSANKVEQQSKEQLARIASISMSIRTAVRKALPAPAEQFFTMMVPGKVLNLDDFTNGFDSNGKLTVPVAPDSVQLAEAILCDDMPALSGVQLAPTGRSVARSYAATLTKLCPAGHTVGVQDGMEDKNFDEAEKRYQNAMQWLTSRVDGSDKTRIDLYTEKQNQYTDAFERKIKAFDAALDRAIKDPGNTTPALQRAAYDRWVKENEKAYHNHVQAAYMDWVSLGKKEEVEYYFAIVDNDSSMARVEASKDAMRDAIIADTDGSTDTNKVSLTPSNWAWLAKQKAQSGPRKETVESLTWKISRLQQINLLLNGMLANPGYVDGATPATSTPSTGTPSSTPVPDTARAAAVAEFLKAMKEYQDAYEASEKAKKTSPDTSGGKGSDLDGKFKAMNIARTKLMTTFDDINKSNINKLNDTAKAARLTLFAQGTGALAIQVTKNEDDIKKYQERLDKLAPQEKPSEIQDNFAIAAGIPPAPPILNPAATEPDFWTSVSVEVSSSYNAEQSSSSSSSFMLGGSASWGLWSVGGSADHSEASSNAAKQMANSSIKASFDCMRVDIARSWLRSELFYDHDLRVASKEAISPGPVTLASLMDPDNYAGSGVNRLEREKVLSRYDLFPMYPTSFLLAANVVLEIQGDSSDIQSHFRTSSTSGSGSIGWGPFSVTSSYSHNAAQADSTCEATASGCKITIKSPQIIGWISEIVPALPRNPINATT